MGELSTDTKTYLASLRASLDARMARATDLVDAAAARDAARAAFDSAQERYAREYRSALDAGWTDKELRDAGLTAPGATPRRPVARRVRQSTASRAVAPAPSGDAPQEETPLAS
jgi:hypothetical protein